MSVHRKIKSASPLCQLLPTIPRKHWKKKWRVEPSDGRSTASRPFPDFSCCPAGGAAGVVSRITGSVGKGLAAITMDKEYQQKRREEMNRPPKDFGESLAKGGKGLLKVQTDDHLI